MQTLSFDQCQNISAGEKSNMDETLDRYALQGAFAGGLVGGAVGGIVVTCASGNPCLFPAGMFVGGVYGAAGGFLLGAFVGIPAALAA